MKNKMHKILLLTQNSEQNPEADVTYIFDLGTARLPMPWTSNDKQMHLVDKQTLQRLNKTFGSFGLVVSRVDEIQNADFASYLYIPGEFCRQSDILEAAALSKKTIFLERGAFLTPKDLLLAQQKMVGTQVYFVDAGSSFGYNDRVLDVRALSLYKSDSTIPFGIHLSELLAPQLVDHSWSQKWTHSKAFLEAFVRTGNALGASFFCVCDSGPGAITPSEVKPFL